MQNDRYSSQLSQGVFILTINYLAYVRWYINKKHETADQSVLQAAIKDSRRDLAEMQKRPEFFDEVKIKRLEAIIKEFEEILTKFT